MRGGVDNCRKANMQLLYSTSYSARILIDQLKRKPSESCQKDVKKLSQTNEKLCPSGNGSMRSTVLSSPWSVGFCRGSGVKCRGSREKSRVEGEMSKVQKCGWKSVFPPFSSRQKDPDVSASVSLLQRLSRI